MMSKIVTPASIVIPAKAGILGDKGARMPHEMPAFAGMTKKGATA